MMELTASSAPYIRTGTGVKRIMLDVIIALSPAVIASVVLYGFYAAAIIVTCVASCVASEYLFNRAAKRTQTAGDLSAVVTGLILALSLNTETALWECALGSAFAIVLVKCVFGGTGCNFANPAAAGRVFMLLSFGSVAGGSMPRMLDAAAGATPLVQLGSGSVSGVQASLVDMLIGLRGGAVGEGCMVALLLGFTYLIIRKTIRWYVPAVFVGTVFICSVLSSGSFVYALYAIMSGGLVFAAVFMASDYVTTPTNTGGKILFALGCGLITFVIRQYFSYPEGAAFAILLMNLLVPGLDRLGAVKYTGGEYDG